MKESTKREVSEFIRDAQYDLVFSTGWMTNPYYIERILQSTKRQVSLLFHLDQAERERVETDPMLFKRMLELRKRGAEYYLQDQSLQYCIRDFSEVLLLDGARCTVVPRGDFEAEHVLPGEAIPLFTSTHDISLEASFSQPVVDKGESVELSWSASNASYVEIIGHEEIPAKGLAELPVNQSTYVTFKATNDRGFEKYKTVQVRLARDVHLNVRLKVFNEWTKEFTSLEPHPKFEDLYGLQRGSLLRLEWQSTEASFCRIQPFGVEQSSGYYDFRLSESLEVTIEYGAGGATKTSSLVLKAFPVSIDQEQLMSRLPSLDRLQEPLARIQSLKVSDVRQELLKQYQRLQEEVATQKSLTEDYLDHLATDRSADYGRD